MAKTLEANPTMVSKVGSVDLKDLVEIAVGKVASQEISRRTMIGDANFRSAIVKLITAYLTNRYVKNRDLKMVGFGVGVDGLEDLVYSFMRNTGFMLRNPFARQEITEEW